MRIHGGSNLNKWIGWFPPLYFIHDLEEILTIEKFLHSQSTVDPIPNKYERVHFGFFTFIYNCRSGVLFRIKAKTVFRNDTYNFLFILSAWYLVS